jgi:hypothetical protein
MKQQWLIVSDEVLVERKAVPVFKQNRRVDPIDPVGNFMDVRPRVAVCNRHFIALIKASDLAWAGRGSARQATVPWTDSAFPHMSAFFTDCQTMRQSIE